MTDNASLSGDEVEALMNGLSEHDATDEAAAQPRPFALGSDGQRPIAALSALDRMSERMVRRLRDAIEPFSRGKPRIDAEPVAVSRFETWRTQRPEFMSLNLYSFRPLKGGLLMAIEPEFVSRLVDSFYGGSGTAAPVKAKEFTATEERLLARLTDSLINALAEVWAEVLPVQPRLTGRETNSAFLSFVRDDEPVALARFTITPAHGRSASLDILYPVVALRAIEGELSSRLHDDGGLAGDEWRQRMASALGQVRLQARSVLARPVLSVSEVLQLAPGDVIPISVPALVPLLVAGRPVGLGRIGDQDGRAALKIEKIENGSLKK